MLSLYPFYRLHATNNLRPHSGRDLIEREKVKLTSSGYATLYETVVRYTTISAILRSF